LLKKLPENVLDQFTDILKLDANDPYSIDYENILDSTKDNVLTYNTITCSDKDNGAGYYTNGAYAYIIKPSAAKKLIDWISINGFLPTDQQLGTRVIHLSECAPGLARLHPFYLINNNIKTMSTTMITELL
jgi:GR25 family glycosyltransferase involved in LPS biosynthesis